MSWSKGNCHQSYPNDVVNVWRMNEYRFIESEVKLCLYLMLKLSFNWSEYAPAVDTTLCNKL